MINKKHIDEPIWVVSTTYRLPKTIEEFKYGWLRDELRTISDYGLFHVLNKIISMLEKKQAKEYKKHKDDKLV